MRTCATTLSSRKLHSTLSEIVSLVLGVAVLKPETLNSFELTWNERTDFHQFHACEDNAGRQHICQ